MIVQEQEDMWCSEAAVAFGFTGGNLDAYNKGLEFFLSGKTRYPEEAKDLATARKWARSIPRFEADLYCAIVSAPLMRAAFEPDLVLLYVNPAQLNQLLLGVIFESGEPVQSKISAQAGCVHYVVPPMKTGNFWISNPCGGDFKMAMNSSNELVFSVPMSKVETLLKGIKQKTSYRQAMPLAYQMEPEGYLPDTYFEVARIMKMY